MNEQELKEISHSLISSVIDGEIEEVLSLLDSFKHGLYNAAIQRGHIHVAELISGNEFRSGSLNTALYVAVSNDDEHLVRTLLKKGADVNAGLDATTQFKLVNPTPLHVAVQNGNETLTRMLLDNLADVHAQARNGTALHVAAYCGHLEIARILLDRDADVNSVCDASSFYCSKYTPLHCAMEKNYKEIMHLLLNKGADVNANLKTEGTPLHVAINFCSYEVAEALLSKEQVDLSARCFRGSRKFRSCDNEDEIRAMNDSKYFTGYTLLHCAAEKGNREFIHLLVSNGMDINNIHHDGSTPLHKAIEFENEDAVKALLSYDHISLNINTTKPTPVVYAALFGREDFVQLILNKLFLTTIAECNCDPRHHVVFRMGYTEAISYLLSYAADGKCEYHIGCSHNLSNDMYIWPETAVDEMNRNSRSLFICFATAIVTDAIVIAHSEYSKRTISKHMAMVKAVGGYVDLVSENLEMLAYSQKYLQEMEGMKTKKIFPSSHLSYFDIFRMSVRGIVKHIEDEDELQVLKLVDHNALFPMCGEDINSQVIRAAERSELLQESDDFFDSLTGALSLSRALPYVCIKKISSFLNNNDLTILKNYKKSN